MEQLEKYYKEVDKFVKKYLKEIVLAMVVILLLMYVVKPLYHSIILTGEWELDDETVIIEDGKCEFEEDDESTKYDCEIKWGKVYIEPEEKGGEGIVLHIKDGKLYGYEAEIVEKK